MSLDRCQSFAKNGDECHLSCFRQILITVDAIFTEFEYRHCIEQSHQHQHETVDWKGVVKCISDKIGRV